MSRWLGWHFLTDKGRTREKSLKPVPGKLMSCRGSLELCYNGLHASKRAIDALTYAPGAMVQRVELVGERVDGEDKSCARSRRCLWMADATETLHEFACWCAEQTLMREREAGREPDPRSWAAIEAKRRWVRGEITDAELDSASSAAYSAYSAAYFASSAVLSASSAAYSAYSAALSAAYSAAYLASSAALSASSAAYSARSAAYSAARSDLNDELERRLLALAPPDYTEVAVSD